MEVRQLVKKKGKKKRLYLRCVCEEMKGRVDLQVTCLAVRQRARKRYHPKPEEVLRGGGASCSLLVGDSGGSLEDEGSSCPWPMPKWRCNVYCKEGSCQLCLLPSQQNGATPPPPPPLKYTDRHRCEDRFWTRKIRSKRRNVFWLTPFGLHWSVFKSVCVDLEPRASPGKGQEVIDRLSTWGLEFPPDAKSLWLSTKGWMHSWPGHELTTFSTASPRLSAVSLQTSQSPPLYQLTYGKRTFLKLTFIFPSIIFLFSSKNYFLVYCTFTLFIFSLHQHKILRRFCLFLVK